MGSSYIISLLLVVVVVAAAAGKQQKLGVHSHQQQKAKQPNIVFILNDDQDLLMDSMSYQPKLQKYITSQGTALTNYFINVPLCCPSRASILRGQYAHNTQIIDLSLPGGGADKFHNLGEDKSTIGVWLKDAGYSTAFYGKYLNSYNCDSAYASTVPPGWDDWFAMCDPGVYNYYNSTYSVNGKITHFPGVYQTETLGNKTVEFIEKIAQQERPFFIHLSGVAPHQPATPAKKYEDLFPGLKAPRRPNFNQADVSGMGGYIKDLPLLTQKDIDDLDDLYRKRIQCLQSVDDNVELIVNTLDKLGILDNTYIIYTADNGFHLGYHRLFEGKRQAFEEDVRVPLIVRGPGVPKNVNISIVAQNVDIAPTIAELAGISTLPDFVDGKSFAAYLKEDEVPEAPFRTAALLCHYGVSSNGDHPNNTWQGLRVLNSTFNGLYTSWCVGDHDYFNIDVHQYEQVNGFKGHQDESLQLDGELRNFFTCKGESCRNLDNSKQGDFKPIIPCYVNK